MYVICFLVCNKILAILVYVNASHSLRSELNDCYPLPEIYIYVCMYIYLCDKEMNKKIKKKIVKQKNHNIKLKIQTDEN